MAGSESDASTLYALPLSEFTSARKELAKQARARGDSDEAERIRRLRKPSLPAWALNMLPRLREAESRELLRAGEQAEAAQAGALAGTGDAVQLQEASEQLRGKARSLAGEAAEILVKGGHAAREETLLRIARALETCAVTAEGRQRLLQGEFVEEPEATGFDLFAQISAAPTGKQKASRQARQPARQGQADARRAAQQALEDARTDLHERRAERAQADAEARAAEREAHDKRKRAARAHEAELESKQRLDEARVRLRGEIGSG